MVMNRLISLELHKLRTTPAAWVAIVITVLLGALSVATNTLGPITPGGPAFGSTDHVNHALSVSALTSPRAAPAASPSGTVSIVKRKL